MTYQLVLSSSTRKYLKKLKRSGTFNPAALNSILRCLEEGNQLPEKCRDHQLRGEFSYFRECHLGFNLLLLYKRSDEARVIIISDIGTHGELFGE